MEWRTWKEVANALFCLTWYIKKTVLNFEDVSKFEHFMVFIEWWNSLKLIFLRARFWSFYISGYRYCTKLLNKAWTQVLRRFKSCPRRVGDPRWWGSLTMVPARNKAKILSSVNYVTKTIHHHHHHHHHHLISLISLYRLRKNNIYKFFFIRNVYIFLNNFLRKNMTIEWNIVTTHLCKPLQQGFI